MTERFLFLSVNSSYSHSSLTLPMLHSACRGVCGWDWDVIECTTAEDSAEAAVRIAERNPTLLGCSLYLFNRNAVLDILSRVNRLLPDCRIVVGGPECAGNAAYELLKKYPFIYTVFVGEAEGIFAEYLADFSSEQERGVIPSDGRALYEKWIDPLPVEDEFFCSSKAFVQVETSRGCPMGCKYCTSSKVPLRLKELHDVRRELELLRSKNIKEVRLLDRTFNLPNWRGAALLKLFREEFSEMQFHLEIHPQYLDDELKKELSIAPNLHIEAGIQSLDEDVQRAIGRNSCRQDVLDGVGFLASCSNFETHVDLICGLPEQDIDSILSDTAVLINLKVDEIQLETLKILHGTPLEEELDKYGIIFAAEPPYDVMQTNTFSAQNILYARKLSRVLDLFYNHASLREIIRSLRFERAEDVRRFFDFMLEADISLNCTLDLKKRLLLLVDFVKRYYSEDAAFEIAKAWLKQGYPIQDVPFGHVERFDGKLPGGLSENERSIAEHRETKFWKLICDKKVFHFAVNRHFKLNGAAFSW